MGGIAMARQKRATWFKLWLSLKPTVDVVSDAAVGRAFKAAFRYFESGELVELDELSTVVFVNLKAEIDKAMGEYTASVEAGQRGAEARWQSKNSSENNPPMPPLSRPMPSPSHPIGSDGEERREMERRIHIVSQEAISLLNELRGSNFKPDSRDTLKHIAARMKEGFELEDFKLVVGHQCQRWKGDPKMRTYLRPSTLFNGAKFEGYLEDARASQHKPEMIAFAPLDDPWEEARRIGNV